MDMEKILAAVAAKHGVSSAEVRRDMQTALELARNKADKTPNEQAMQKAVGVAAEEELAGVIHKAADKVIENL